MENNNQITNASYWKRFIAFAIDAILAIGIGFVLYLFVTSTYLFDSIGGKDAEQKLAKYYDETGLIKVEKNDDGSYNKNSVGFYMYKASDDDDATKFVDAPDGKTAYQAYYDMVYDYYTVKLPTALEEGSDFVVLKDSDGKAFSSVDDYKRYFNQTIFGLPALDDLTKVDEASRSSQNNTYFCLALNEAKDAVDPLAKPVLKEEYQKKVAEGDMETIKNLRNFFYDSNATDSAAVGKYYDAIQDALGGSSNSVQTYCSKMNAIITPAQAVAQVAAFIPSIFVFFFVIPVCVPKGKTIGKLIFNLHVISADGFAMNWIKRILRPLIIAILLSLLFVPYQIAIIAFFVLFLVDALSLGFSKSGMAIHDHIVKTQVVDGKKSHYFKDIAAKEEYLEEHPEEKESEEKEEIDYAMEAAIKAQERVLDLDTIMKNREEARSITSFDEFEEKKGAELDTLKANSGYKEVNLSKEEDEK